MKDNLPTIPERLKVVAIVVKAGLGATIPSATTELKPAVYNEVSFILDVNGSTGGAAITAAACALGAATASSLGGGAGGSILPCNSLFINMITTQYFQE